jgi:hypothetical protein
MLYAVVVLDRHQPRRLIGVSDGPGCGLLNYRAEVGVTFADDLSAARQHDFPSRAEYRISQETTGWHCVVYPHNLIARNPSRSWWTLWAGRPDWPSRTLRVPLHDLVLFLAVGS